MVSIYTKSNELVSNYTNSNGHIYTNSNELVSIYTNSNGPILYNLFFFNMFSCILSFDDMPFVLLSYKLRFGTQLPVGPL